MGFQDLPCNISTSSLVILSASVFETLCGKNRRTNGGRNRTPAAAVDVVNYLCCPCRSRLQVPRGRLSQTLIHLQDNPSWSWANASCQARSYSAINTPAPIHRHGSQRYFLITCVCVPTPFSIIILSLSTTTTTNHNHHHHLYTVSQKNDTIVASQSSVVFKTQCSFNNRFQCGPSRLVHSVINNLYKVKGAIRPLQCRQDAYLSFTGLGSRSGYVFLTDIAPTSTGWKFWPPKPGR